MWCPNTTIRLSRSGSVAYIVKSRFGIYFGTCSFPLKADHQYAQAGRIVNALSATSSGRASAAMPVGPWDRVAANRGIPLFLCEQNAYPGLVNRWLAGKRQTKYCSAMPPQASISTSQDHRYGQSYPQLCQHEQSRSLRQNGTGSQSTGGTESGRQFGSIDPEQCA